MSSASGSSWIGTNNIPVEGNIKEVLNYTIIEDGFYRMTVHCNWTSSGYYVYSYIYMGTYHHTYLSEKGSGAGGGNLIFQTPIYYLFKNNIARVTFNGHLVSSIVLLNVNLIKYQTVYI